MLTEPPVRLCCGQRHGSVICPDGLIMCQLCYGRFMIDQLNILESGGIEDVCEPCGVAEKLGYLE